MNEGLSDAHRAALTALIGRCPDPMLATLSRTVRALPGEKAREMGALLREEGRDRRRRAFVLGPVAPMFRARADGLPSLTFPVPVLDRLWALASRGEPGLLPGLDDPDEPSRQVIADRIGRAAAAAVRDRPGEVWPASLDPDGREAGLKDLAACLDLGHIVRPRLPLLQQWLKRPDEAQLAELRLMLRDAALLQPDGAVRAMEMLFAALDDAALVMRLVTQTSSSADQEAVLSGSEMAGFVNRLIDGVEARAVRIAAFRPERGGDPAQVVADMGWCAAVISELDVTLALRTDTLWGGAVRQARSAISTRLSDLFRAAGRAVEKALPTTRRPGAIRSPRRAPDLNANPTAEAAEQAHALLSITAAVRGPASIFGCESARRKTVDGLVSRLFEWGDDALDAVDDDLNDPERVLAMVETAARLLDAVGAAEPAQTLRRRARVVDGRRAPASRTGRDNTEPSSAAA